MISMPVKSDVSNIHFGMDRISENKSGNFSTNTATI